MSHGSSLEWLGRLVRYAPVLFWIGVIFYLSSGAGAMSETSRFVRPVLEFLFPSADAETIKAYHGYVRKFAHFAEYAMLAYFAARALLGSRIDLLRCNWTVFALGLVLLIASIDEIGQSFDPSRTGSLYDVMIDMAGGASMVLFIWLSKGYWIMQAVLGIPRGQQA